MKKIIALVTASFLILRFFALTIYADYTYYDYLKEFWSATGNFISGDYTFSEYSSAVTAAAERWAVTPHLSSKADAIVGNVGNIVNDYGPAATDVIKGWTSDLFSDYQTTENVSTTDLNGCGAFYERYRNGSLDYRVYCDYIVITSEKYCSLNGLRRQEFYSNGELTQSTDYVDNYDSDSCQIGMSIVDSSSSTIKLYGDVRYNDGTPAETDDEYATISKYDFTQKQDPNNFDPNNPNNPDNLIPTTAQELEELLDAFNEILENNNPDLSTMESTLKSIYRKLGQLDSDNDNELLLKILNSLNLIKKALPDKDKDFKIDEDLQNTNGEKLKQKLMEKFSFIIELKNFVTYIFDVYKNSSEAPEISLDIYGETYKINMDIFKNYLPLLQSILAAYIYISYAYHTYRKIPSYINGGDNE